MRNPWKLTSLVLAMLLVLVVGIQTRSAVADNQPNMQSALGALESAYGSLERATADKGGHRVKAMSLTRQAIDETKKGIKFDNRH
jgi:hypothetical protein